MGREEVEIAFGTAFTDPGSVKSGEYLREHILAAAERFVASDRSALLEVLTEWLQMRDEPHTMLAVAVIGRLGLGELYGELQQLKAEIDSGRVFWQWYGRKVDAALARIKTG